jgi:hypothetical protein
VYRPMTGSAEGRVRIAAFCRASVDALRKFFHFRGMTFRTLPQQKLRRSGHFMNIAVTRGAGRFAQDRVDAFRGVRRLFRVASFTFHFWNFRRVRKILDGRVTVRAAQNSVHARGMLFRVDGDVFPFFGFHVWPAMTGETGFILLGKL